MKILLLAGLLCANLCSQTKFAHAQGKDLVDGDGRELLLRGTNLGNWLEPEGYMFLFEKGPVAPREIEEFFDELVGPAYAADYWREYRRTYVTRADIQFIHKSGFNSARIPLHYRFFLSENSEGFDLLDSVVAWCKQEHLWVILDLHCAPGGQTGTNIDDSWGYPWLFEEPADQQQTIDVWKRIANHYRDEPAILGYDLLNEPIPHFAQVQKYNDRLEPLYQRIGAAIREVDSHHVLIFEGAQWGGNFRVFGKPFDLNAMYSFHKYWMTPDQSSVREYVDFRNRYRVPIWLGESGENTDEWVSRFRALLEKNNIGWCFWPFKKMEKSSAPVSIRRPARWDAIVAYAAIPGGTGDAEKRIAARPSVEDARAALTDLLRKIRFENCRVNAGYLQALGLTPGT